jgi:hypothetical protein
LSFRQKLQSRHLTVVPAISSALDDPADGSDDAEDTCDPMTAIENADCLNDTRRSGARMDFVGKSVRMWAIITNLPWDTEDPKIEDQRVQKPGHGNESYM